MRIVIEIPEKIYSYITTQWRDVPKNDSPISIMCNAIIDGVPLPKGHGRLISEPTKEEIAKTVGGQNDFAECIRDSVKVVFDNTPTIIEADKED